MTDAPDRERGELAGACVRAHHRRARLFAGVRVIEVAAAILVPYMTSLLAAQGAHVIKVEDTAVDMSCGAGSQPMSFSVTGVSAMLCTKRSN